LAEEDFPDNESDSLCMSERSHETELAPPKKQGYKGCGGGGKISYKTHSPARDPSTAKRQTQLKKEPLAGAKINLQTVKTNQKEYKINKPVHKIANRQ